MKKVYFEFLPNGEGKYTSATILADEIEHREDFVVAWKGESIVAIVPLSQLKCCYLLDNSYHAERSE